jgi:hypothetical protein
LTAQRSVNRYLRLHLAEKPDVQKTPIFYESAERAETAKAATSFNWPSREMRLESRERQTICVERGRSIACSLAAAWSGGVALHWSVGSSVFKEQGAMARRDDNEV